jgi:hypothetical protein
MIDESRFDDGIELPPHLTDAPESEPEPILIDAQPEPEQTETPPAVEIVQADDLADEIAPETPPEPGEEPHLFGTSPSFVVSPTTGYSGGSLSITATGTSTAWTSGTTFNVAGGSGATITGTSVNAGAQTATFTLAAGTVAGTLTIGDSTDAATATVTISTPSFTVKLPPVNATTRRQMFLVLSGTHTNWTTATRWTCSGGTSSVLQQWYGGAGLYSLVINTGHGATTLTLSNSTDDSTATVTIVNAHKHRRGSASDGPVLDLPMYLGRRED